MITSLVSTPRETNWDKPTVLTRFNSYHLTIRLLESSIAGRGYAKRVPHFLGINKEILPGRSFAQTWQDKPCLIDVRTCPFSPAPARKLA